MSDFEIRHHTEFDTAWKKAIADGKLSKEEIADLKKAAAKTADPKSVAKVHTDDHLVEQLEGGLYSAKVTFTHTGGKNVTAELNFIDGELTVKIEPKQVTDKNVDVFLQQFDRDGYASEADEKAVEQALKNVSKGSKAHKALTAWLDEKRPGATAESRKALTQKVLDPKVPEKERFSAYLTLCLYSDKDPKAVRDLSFKIYEGKIPASTEARELAAGKIKDEKWGNQKLYVAMLDSNNPSIRRSGIEGLGGLGTKEAVAILDKHHQTTASQEDKYLVIMALWDIEKKGPAKDEASEAARRLGKKADEEFTAEWKKEEGAKATKKSIAEATAGFGPKDAKAVKAYLATHGDDVLDYGSAADKGKMVGILLKDSSPEAKKWVYKLLMSEHNQQGINGMVIAMLAISKSPPNLEGYLGREKYDAYTLHRAKVFQLDDEMQINTHQIAKKGSFEKKVGAVGAHIGLAQVGMEDKGVAAARVKELLLSLGSREEYERAIKLLAKQGFAEKDLIWLLGDVGLKEVFNAFNHPEVKAPAVKVGEAPKWSGGKVLDYAAKGANVPDKHDKKILDKFIHHAVHFGAEHGALAVAEHALAHWGYHAAGVAVQGAGVALAAVAWMKMVFEELGDANGPGQWRNSLHYGYESGYADGVVAMATLWAESKDMDDFMAKLSTIMPNEGDLDMSDDRNQNFRSLGKFQGKREAIVHMLSLLDPNKGGNPEKLASFLDALVEKKKSNNVDFKGDAMAAVSRTAD